MSDKNWQSYYGDNPDVSGFVNPIYPQDYDDIMKFSDCMNVLVTNKDIAAGSGSNVNAGGNGVLSPSYDGGGGGGGCGSNGIGANGNGGNGGSGIVIIRYAYP